MVIQVCGELRQFLSRRKAEAVMAALTISNVAETEHALSAPLNNAEAIYKANLKAIRVYRGSDLISDENIEVR